MVLQGNLAGRSFSLPVPPAPPPDSCDVRIDRFFSRAMSLVLSASCSPPSWKSLFIFSSPMLDEEVGPFSRRLPFSRSCEHGPNYLRSAGPMENLPSSSVFPDTLPLWLVCEIRSSGLREVSRAHFPRRSRGKCPVAAS